MGLTQEELPYIKVNFEGQLPELNYSDTDSERRVIGAPAHAHQADADGIRL